MFLEWFWFKDIPCPGKALGVWGNGHNYHQLQIDVEVSCKWEVENFVVRTELLKQTKSCIFYDEK